MVYSANPISKEQLQRAINAQLEEAGLPTDEDALIEMIEEYGGGGGGSNEFAWPANFRSYTSFDQLSPILHANEWFNVDQDLYNKLFDRTLNITFDPGETEFSVGLQMIKFENGALVSFTDYQYEIGWGSTQQDLYDALFEKGDIGPTVENNVNDIEIVGWSLNIFGAKINFTGQSIQEYLRYYIQQLN